MPDVKIVTADLLTPGTKLAQDIMAGTQVLLRRGTTLTADQVERIRRLDLPGVAIVGQAAQPAEARRQPGLADLHTADEPSWISDEHFSREVHTGRHIEPAEQQFSEHKHQLRSQAGLKPLLPQRLEHSLQRGLEATYIQSAVQQKVSLERLEGIARELAEGLATGGEYTAFEDVQKRSLEYNDIERYGQHLVAANMMSIKLLRVLEDSLEPSRLAEEIKGQLAMSNIFTLLPAQVYRKSNLLENSQHVFYEALQRYGEWLRGRRFVDEGTLERQLQRMFCLAHGEKYGALPCQELQPASQRLVLAGFYADKLYSQPGRPRQSPHDAAQRVVQHSERTYSSKEANAFLNKLGYYPVGTLVQLSDNRLALVARQNSGALLKPVVHPLASPGKLDGEVDLTQEDGLFIRRQLLEY